MKGAAVVLSAGTLVVVSLACAAGTDEFSEAHRDAMRDSVGQAMDRFGRHSANADWDSLAALYSGAADFRFLESGAIQYESRDEIRSALDEVPTGTHISTTYRDLRIDPIAPGVALVTGLFDTVFADGTGPRFQFAGAVTLLWVHEPEGWRISSGHSSAPVPRDG